MTLQELRASPHLSASSIGDYLDCGLLYKLGRIDRFQPEGKADALEFGTVIHVVLGELYQQKLAGIEMSLKDLQESFEKHWTRVAKDREDIIYGEGKSFEVLMLEGKELLSAYWHKKPEDSFTIIAIEEPFSINLPGCDIPIIGAMDLVEEDDSGTLVITDFKTSGRSYSRDEVDRNFQMTLYQMAARKMGYDDREILLRFDCLIKTRTPKFEQYYTIRSDMDEKRAMKKIIEVWKGISRGVFIPNDSPTNWKCKGCSFKKHCDDWFAKEAA